MEQLQSRIVFAIDALGASQTVVTQPAIDIDAPEQLMIELVNRARANPVAEAQRFGIGLNDSLAPNTISTAPKQPLAPNASLSLAAERHSADMLARNYFDHVSPENSTPTSRAAAAGYTGGVGENLALRSISGSELNGPVSLAHEQLVESSGHRTNIMNPNYTMLGVGIGTGNYTFSSGGSFPSLMTTEKFGLATSQRFITGVAYTDAVVADDFYTIGEGLSGIVIEAVNGQGERFSTITGRSGGYALAVPNGTYTITARNVAAGTAADLGQVSVNSANIKIDVTPSQFVAETPAPDPTPSTPTTPTTPTIPGTPIATDIHDINGDGNVTAADALAIIHHLNQSDASYTASLDVNQDNRISAADALQVINEMNLRVLELQTKSAEAPATVAPSASNNDDAISAHGSTMACQIDWLNESDLDDVVESLTQSRRVANNLG